MFKFFDDLNHLINKKKSILFHDNIPKVMPSTSKLRISSPYTESEILYSIGEALTINKTRYLYKNQLSTPPGLARGLQQSCRNTRFLKPKSLYPESVQGTPATVRIPLRWPLLCKESLLMLEWKWKWACDGKEEGTCSELHGRTKSPPTLSPPEPQWRLESSASDELRSGSGPRSGAQRASWTSRAVLSGWPSRARCSWMRVVISRWNWRICAWSSLITLTTHWYKKKTKQGKMEENVKAGMKTNEKKRKMRARNRMEWIKDRIVMCSYLKQILVIVKKKKMLAQAAWSYSKD